MEKLNLNDFDQKVAAAFLKSIKKSNKDYVLTLNNSYNFVTGQQYKGVQRILLEAGAYATFNQIAEAGGKIKKGSKAIKLTFAKDTTKRSKKAFKGAKLNKKAGLYELKTIEPKNFNLFKLADTEGVQAEQLEVNKYNSDALKSAASELIQCDNAHLNHLTLLLVGAIVESFNNRAFKFSKQHYDAVKEGIKSNASIVRHAFDLAEKCINDAIKAGAGAIVETKETIKDTKKVKKAETKETKEPETIRSAAHIPAAQKQEIKSMEQVIQDYHLENYGSINSSSAYACTSINLSKLYC